jgi:hypothetical protein
MDPVRIGEEGSSGGLSLRAALGRVTSILCIPYGYTVSLGCAALLSAARLGPPTEWDVLGFAAGGVGAFLGLAYLGRKHLAAEVPMRVPAPVVFNLFPLAAVLVLLVVPTAGIGRGAGYFLNAFLVTVVYLMCLAAFVWRLGRPAAGREPG